MQELLVVDGYNIINAWNQRSALASIGLESARDALCARLSSFCAFIGWKLLVVFDAHLTGGVECAQDHGHMKVIYTKRGETADGYIERFVRQAGGNIRVATNDAMEQTMILGAGAARMSARELLEQVRRAEKAYAGYAPHVHMPLEMRVDAAARDALEGWRRQ